MYVYFEGCVKPALVFACDKDVRGNSHGPHFPYTAHEPELIYKGSFRHTTISILEQICWIR